MIWIVSLQNDLHALHISRLIRETGRCDCHVIESNTISQRETIDWRLADGGIEARFRTSSGEWVSALDATALWLRRPHATQVTGLPDSSAGHKVIDHDCAGSLRGVLTTTFNGEWISSFEALSRGSDKLYQLAQAARCGFRVPNTLVTQSRDAVVGFHIQNQGRIIVKTIVGAHGPVLLTRQLSDPNAFPPEAYLRAPAFYQELIPGTRHIRLLMFGNQSIAASLDSHDLDWRLNLNVPIAAWSVPPSVHTRARRTLDAMGLKMGVIDLKETPEGEIVWFEVNPQGQFLFLEPLAKLDFAWPFAEYLIREANAGRVV